MATIFEDFQKVIQETTEAYAYWEGFKDLYVEKAQWNLDGKQVFIEVTPDFSNREDIAHWKTWQVTKAIMKIYPELQKLKLMVPTYQRIYRKRTFDKKKIWLIYEVTPLAYVHFLQELVVKQQIKDDKELARLFGKYFSRHRNRRAA